MIQQEPQRQNILLILFIIAAGFVLGYVYYSQFAPAVNVPPAKVGPEDGIKKYKDLTVDFGVLDNNEYKVLKVFGEAPVKIDKAGKKNFFAPIQ